MILEALPDSPGFGLSHFLNRGYEILHSLNLENRL